MQTDTDKVRKNAPVISVTEKILMSLKDSMKNGEKIELVPFRKWQKEHHLKMILTKKAG